MPEEEEKVGKECSGTEVGCTSSSSPFSLERYGISVQLFLFAFCMKEKDKQRQCVNLFVYGLWSGVGVQ